jgi:alkylhydroperoxidase family enzyme
MTPRIRPWPLPERLLGWLGARPRDNPVPLPGPRGLPAYARMGWSRPTLDTLSPRLRLLVAQLAALRSGCGYCAHYNRHIALRAGMPVTTMDAVAEYAAAPQFSDDERAALALADALTEFTEAEGGFATEILVRARCHLREDQIMALVATVATEHFFDPGTGHLGRDALAPTR